MATATDTMYDEAQRLGTEFALDQMNGGQIEPDETPLSGEWAGGITRASVLTSIGAATVDDESIEWLLDTWETAYFSAFSTFACVACG